MPNPERVEAEKKMTSRLEEARTGRMSKAVKGAQEKRKEEEERLVSSGLIRPAPGTYNGPQIASKAKAQAVVERAKAVIAAKKAAKEQVGNNDIIFVHLLSNAYMVILLLTLRVMKKYLQSLDRPIP